MAGFLLPGMHVWFVRYTSVKDSGLSRLSHNLALVFSDLVFPAVAGLEHMRCVTHWQPCPVGWLI